MMIFLFSCTEEKTRKATQDTIPTATAVKPAVADSTADLHIHVPVDTTGKPIFILKDPAVQQALLDQIDQWYSLKGDTTGHYKKSTTDVALTPAYLKDFLKNADLSKVYDEGGLSKTYNFNTAIKPYKDSPACSDSITLRYTSDEDAYTLVMESNFMVDETTGCNGTQNNIMFKISGAKITLVEIVPTG